MSLASLTAASDGLLGGIGTPGAGDWKASLLRAIGAPVTAGNMKALELWATSEGTGSNNNWLAISDGANRYPHGKCLAQCGTSSPIYAFPSQDVGVQATAAFLTTRDSAGYYRGVVDAFRNDAGLSGIYQAINASPWCRGCQSGHYPVALYQGLNGPLAPAPGAGGSSSSGSPSSTPVGLSNDSDCFIGPFVMPGNIPNIPCLFFKSWGWAMLGATALVGGGVVMIVGALVIASKTNTVKDVARFVPGVNPSANRKGLLESASSSQPPATSSSSSAPTKPAPRSYNTDEDAADQARRFDLGGRGSTTASERRVDRRVRIEKTHREHEARRARTRELKEEPF